MVPTVYQILDITHKAWHAGQFNEGSIGVDICQQAGVEWYDHYLEHEYDLDIFDNPSSRGPRKVLTLNAKLRDAVSVFCVDLLNALDLKIVPAPTASGAYVQDVKKGNISLYGHSHVNKRKWDIAPFYDDIIEGINQTRV